MSSPLLELIQKTVIILRIYGLPSLSLLYNWLGFLVLKIWFEFLNLKIWLGFLNLKID